MCLVNRNVTYLHVLDLYAELFVAPTYIADHGDNIAGIMIGMLFCLPAGDELLSDFVLAVVRLVYLWSCTSSC